MLKTANCDCLTVEKMKEIVNLVSKEEELIIMGDLNIDYANKKSAKDLIALEREFHIKQRINMPTRVTKQTKTTIDHIYTNSEKVRSSGILDINISDHYPVFIVLKKLPTAYERVSFKCRQTKYLNLDELHQQLNDEDWSKFYNETDVNAAWSEIYNIYTAVLDRLCPTVEYVNVKRKQEWISASLFELMKRRDHCYKVANRTGEKSDWAAAKKQRNITNDACNKAKGDFIREKLKEDSGNPRKFWGHLKPLIKQSSSEQTQVDLDDSNCNNTVPNMFNKFFSNIGIDLKNKIKPLNASEKKQLGLCEPPEHGNNGPKFTFRKTNTIEVESVIKKLHNHKSSGVPNISSYLLKQCLKATLNQVVFLINMSIETMQIPTLWKCATITTVHKAGSPRIPDNYRPISVLPIMAKLLEKCIHTQLITFLEQNSILADNQFGFRAGHSTNMAVTTLLTDIYESYNSGKFTKLCYIDLKKAFDTVSYPVLYRKMESVGISGCERKWFENYLSGRMQAVKVNGELSEWEGVRCGVPQGSTLGPLLFLIYVNDISTAVECSFILFADDTVLYTSDVDYGRAVHRLQTSIDKFTLCSRNSALTINTSKSKTMSIMPFNSRKKREQITNRHQMTMLNVRLEEVGLYKYLGVHIDEDLSFNPHIRAIIKNVAHKIYLLCKIRSKVTMKVAADVYKAMILHLFDVGDVFYHGATQTMLNKIESLQNRAIRVVAKMPRISSVQEELKKRKLLSLERRRKLHLAQLARWMSSKDKFKDHTMGITRSHAQDKVKLKVIYPTKNKVQRSFIYQATTLWNNLPAHLHGVKKAEDFKKQYTRLIGNN